MIVVGNLPIFATPDTIPSAEAHRRAADAMKAFRAAPGEYPKPASCGGRAVASRPASIKALPSNDGRRDERLAVCEKCENFDLSNASPICKLLGSCMSNYDMVLRGYAAPPAGCPLNKKETSNGHG